ncbi:hypothetical protein M0R45_024573 [Rubus argutus]|uniref:Uncharacterized protein n=1 Tax=Rubus argutus TaxID=59490 RepID=A0AAW1WUL2_RUBAR
MGVATEAQSLGLVKLTAALMDWRREKLMAVARVGIWSLGKLPCEIVNLLSARMMGEYGILRGKAHGFDDCRDCRPSLKEEKVSLILGQRDEGMMWFGQLETD